MKIVSGGQTGADRGALEAALELGVPYGGKVPRGRLAEDGVVPACFAGLEETESSDYPVRTWQNVLHSDGTAIFCRVPAVGGSRLTVRFCRLQDKPFVVFSVQAVFKRSETCVAECLEFVRRHGIRTLNVAGSRESVAPGIQAAVKKIVMEVLRSWPK